MDAKEKIIASIMDEAEASAKDIILDAEKRANEISEQIKSEAKCECDAIISAAEKRAEDIKKSSESSVALLRRDKLLRLKGEIIEGALDGAEEKIIALADKEYFDFLLEIARKTALEKEGEIFLCEKDLKRDYKDFEKAVKGLSLNLSKKSADISGGFILKYGDIEINGEISALIREKREILVDIANKMLF